MIWKNKPTIEAIESICKQTMVEHLGIKITDVGDDSLSATMPVDHRTIQPARLLHGGASVALAESLGSIASFLCVDITKQNVVGLEINANHIRAVKSGFVEGKATPIHLGRSTHIWEIRIIDESDRLVCISRLTVAILERE